MNSNNKKFLSDDDTAKTRRRHDDDSAFDLFGVDLCSGDVLPTNWNPAKSDTFSRPTSCQDNKDDAINLAKLLARRELAHKAAWLKLSFG